MAAAAGTGTVGHTAAGHTRATNGHTFPGFCPSPDLSPHSPLRVGVFPGSDGLALSPPPLRPDMRVVWLVTVAALVAPLSALRPILSGVKLPQHRRAPPPRMAKTKAKASKKPGQAKPRGFGKPPPKQGVLLEDPAYAELNEQLTAAGANLARVAIADFDGLRGVMALVDLKRGDEIVSHR